VNKKVLIVEDQFVEANDLQLMLCKAGYEVCGIARSVAIAREIVKKEQPGLVLVDIFLKGKETGIDLARQLKEEHIAFIYLSANSNEDILAQAKTTEPYGFIVKPFREKDILVTLEIARYRHEQGRESRYRRETDLIQQLEITAAASFDRNKKLLQTTRLLQQEIPFDYLAIGFDTATKRADSISFLRIGFNEYQTIGIKELSTITGTSIDELMKMPATPGKEKGPAFFNQDAFEQIARQASLPKLTAIQFHLQSMLSFPMLTEAGPVCMQFYSRRADTYAPEQIALLHRLQPHLSRLINQVQVAGEMAAPATTKETSLRHDSKPAHITGFEGIIGNSPLLVNVLDQIAQVAPFDTSVLILGETGTGKERIADCIHHHSSRKGKPFVKINCAALPATLIESELFGHEKGSFTGATDKRIGKFEQANGGTIFLDEIGDMPVDLQVRLLRVLQEKEIEPVGRSQSLKVDVRVIAATNRNLEKEVAEGRFRLDLYYRLNVFPIELPSLRDRIDDIPALAQHFLQLYNRKAGKNITGLSDKVVKTMMTHHWPGNIRELEHLIERSVLLAKGCLIEELPLPARSPIKVNQTTADSTVKTIHENERDHIVSVLKKCGGKVWGVGGAAEILNLPPSTLKSKMKKLGIGKEGS
jgi:DNA-binding NtrC family response regulator